MSTAEKRNGKIDKEASEFMGRVRERMHAIWDHKKFGPKNIPQNTIPKHKWSIVNNYLAMFYVRDIEDIVTSIILAEEYPSEENFRLVADVFDYAYEQFMEGNLRITECTGPSLIMIMKNTKLVETITGESMHKMIDLYWDYASAKKSALHS